MTGVVLIAASALLALACLHAALLVWRWRSTATNAEAMSLVLASESVWAAAYAAELAAPDLEGKLLWDAIQGLPAVSVPIASLGLVWRQRGGAPGFARGWLLAAGIAGSLFAISLLVTTPYGLTRLNPHWELNPWWPALGYELSLWEQLVYSLASGCALASLILLAHGARVDPLSMRGQMWELLAALGPGTAVAVLGLCDVRIVAQRDTTPLWFGIGLVGSSWSLFRYRLLDLGPMARRVLVEQLPDAVLVLDRWGRVLESNAAAERVLGRGASPGRDLGAVFPEVEPALRAPRGELFELARGSRDFEARCLPLTNGAGELRGSVLCLRDVTAQHEAERRVFDAEQRLDRRLRERTAQLEASERHLRAFFEQASGAALLISQEGRLLAANRAARTQIGLGFGVLLGTPLSQALALDRDRARFQDALSRAVAGEHVTVEIEIARGAGANSYELALASLGDTRIGQSVILMEVRAPGERRPITRVVAR